MPKLTAAAVEKFAPGRKRREIRDDGTPGLYLVIQPVGRGEDAATDDGGRKPKRRGRRRGGGKSWCMRFRRPDGRAGKLALGPVDISGTEMPDEPVIGGPLTLAGARQLAAAVNRARAMGRDVVAEHAASRRRRILVEQEATTNTFAAGARDFVEEHARPKTRRWRETARLLGLVYPLDGGEPTVARGSLADRWADRPAREIDGHDIYGAVDEARRTGVPGLDARSDGPSEARARALYSALSSCFGWLLRHRRVERNPCVGVFRPPAPPARERVLTASEVRLFWLATDHVDAPRPQYDADGNEREQPRPFGPLLRLLLLTGARLREVAGMVESELPGGDEWHLPGARTKNKKPHVVPLAPLAREQIEAGRKTSVAGKAGHIFSTTGASPPSGWSKTKARLDEQMLRLARAEAEAAGRDQDDVSIPPWRLHDLRRTAATGMADLGVPPHIVEAALNHVSGARAGVAGTYNRAAYSEEKRAALARWATHVHGVVSGKKNNVVSIRGGTKP
ncbi:MAG: tyrosine-type recombinase/integrase [Variibacter sp.]